MSDATVIKFEERAMVSLAGCEAQRKFRLSSIRPYHGAANRDHVAEYVFRAVAPNEAPIAD
jgi:hypothetical protein